MPSTRKKWTANSIIGRLTLIVISPPTLNRSSMSLSQLAQVVALSRVLQPVLSTLSKQNSRPNERHLARRTISAYPVCTPRFIILSIPANLDRAFPLSSGLCSQSFWFYYLQELFAISSCTMDSEVCTAVLGRPSSAIFRRGPSTSPCMTESRPALVNCLWA